ncbi:AraC family transcriptional regulator, partial [Clostridium perfringens]|nr:AraC family transcriptional regulator [Clostridium perfringens]
CHIKFNNKINKCGTDSIILIRPNNNIEIELKAYTSLVIYELEITEKLLNTLSEEEVNLAESFNTVPFECAIIDANAETTMLIKNILKKLIYMKQESYRFADNLYIKS